jgi:hypothetical protein
VNDAPSSPALIPGLRQNIVHLRAIGEADWRTGGIGYKLADEIPGDRLLFVNEQKLFELADVFRNIILLAPSTRTNAEWFGIG